MGLEYKIETYDAARAGLPELLRRLPEFQSEDACGFHLGNSGSFPLVTVKLEDDHVYVCQHGGLREADALFGLIIRHLLSVNDHVVISEI